MHMVRTDHQRGAIQGGRKLLKCQSEKETLILSDR